MDAISNVASRSASIVSTAASTLFYYTNTLDWGSKGWNFFFIVSNDGLWIYGFSIGFNIGSASHITLIVSDPSANILAGYPLCGLTV